MAYTVVNLSYGSLSTVMTTNPEDIAQLNSWRMMGTNLSSVLLNAITAPLLMKFSGGSESYTAGAYTKVAILFAIDLCVSGKCMFFQQAFRQSYAKKYWLKARAFGCNHPVQLLRGDNGRRD